MIEKVTDEFTINQLLSYFKTSKDDNPFTEYLIYKDHSIKGFVSYSIMYERVEVNYIFVLEEYRRSNIASKLLEHLIKTVKDKENITLEVNETNKPAIKLYEKYGFKKATKRANYYGADSALLMIKKLGD